MELEYFLFEDTFKFIINLKFVFGVEVGADGLDVGSVEGAEIKAVGTRVGTAERSAEGRGVGTEDGFLVGMDVVGAVVGTILVIALVPICASWFNRIDLSGCRRRELLCDDRNFPFKLK